MPQHGQRLVAVLYEHPLLGEGIARILLGETDADVAAASADDRRAVATLLARQPSVVIFEGTRAESDSRRLAPQAVLIDVTSAMSTDTRHSRTVTGLTRIIQAVRGTESVV